MNKPSYGVIVGRFQVNDLHDGHMELFRIVRSRHNRVLVFIGVAPAGLTRNNPLDYETRRRMIQAKFPDISTAPLPDVNNDVFWSENLDKEISKQLSADFGEVTLYGGRDSFVPHYHGRHKPVELPIEVKVSGAEIRDRLTNTVMESADFRSGCVYTVNNIRPRVIPCVDIIIARDATLNENDRRTLILIARKCGEVGWRFVGGHAEVTSPDFESDAKREAYEETHCDVDSLEYIGSALVDDWRWRKDPDKIKTLIFIGWTSSSLAEAHDDIAEARWVALGFLENIFIVPEHVVIYEKLKKHMEKRYAATARS
jgi:bifunctional NMN adenylyltransferase/nudix hydrolase